MSGRIEAADACAALMPLLGRYHSAAAARRRLHATRLEDAYGSFASIARDLPAIRRLADGLLERASPVVSIVVPAFDEEVELIPTVLTLLWSVASSRIPTEVVAVDNESDDRSGVLLSAMGLEPVRCATPGLRFARAAGLAAAQRSTRYVWLIDADTRLLAPLRRGIDPASAPNPLSISYKYLEENPDCAATSTGIVFECQVPLRRLVRAARLLARGGLPYSCWTGPNQFIRRDALLAIGGIDLQVDGGEDHHRIFELTRYARRTGGFVRGADREFSLYCPVYTSDRRNATLAGMLRNFRQQRSKPKYVRDEFGLPVHPRGVRHKDLFRRERGRAKP